MVQVLCDALAAIGGGPRVLGVRRRRSGFCVCAGGGLCVVVRVWVCFGAFLVCEGVRVFVCACVCVFFSLCVFCLPSLRLV